MVIHTRVLPKWSLWEGTGKQIKLLITRAIGKSYQELSDSAGCSLGHVLV